MATIRKPPSAKSQAIVRLNGLKSLYANFSTKTKQSIGRSLLSPARP